MLPGHADVVRVEGVLDGGQVGEERRVRPGEVDALEDDVLEHGELAAEDDDGGRADRAKETFGGLPVLDVPELEGAEEGRGAAGVEDLAGVALALEVGDLEVELSPAGNVGKDNVEGGHEGITEDEVLAMLCGLFCACVDVDVYGEAGIA